MKPHNGYQLWLWTIVLALGAIKMSPAIAQTTPDATLGRESSVMTPNQLINGLLSDRVDGGAIRGTNLFHSFTDFNIPESRGVYFTNPAGVENIISRVTGNNPSNLLGTLGVLGNANLFLLNPNGIIFGANARLDVRGSFTASTSDRFQFSDGSEFSAVNPQAPPLLTVTVPLGLQYGTARGSILNQANLVVGQDLTLHGGSISSRGQLTAANGELTVRSTTGDIDLNHFAAQTATITSAQNLNLIGSQLLTQGDLTLYAQDTVRVRDTVSQPVLLWAGGQLLVQGDRAIDIFALNHPNSHLVSGRDMILRSSSPVGGDAHYWAGGNIRIEQLDGSLGNLFSPYDPIFYATGDVQLGGYSGFSLHIFAGGKVTIPGPISITGAETAAVDTIIETIPLPDGSVQVINGLASPTLDIRAGTLAPIPPPGYTLDLNDSTPPFSFIPLPYPNPNAPATSADITIGNINIAAPNGTVFLSNHYQPNLGLPGGDITVNGVNGLGIRTNIAAGNSGSVTIDARNSITLNAPIDTSSATGIAGNVKLLAGNTILTNAPIDTHSDSIAGSVTLLAGNTILTNAPIDTRSDGIAGDVTLLAGNNIFANTRIDTRSTGGNAGQVGLFARNNIQIDRSITTDVLPGSIGNAGNIQIDASQITIQNGAQLTANTFSSGSGGNIQINAQQLTLQNNAQLSSITGDDLRINPLAISNTGSGGNITITADTISLLDQSFIIAQTNSLSSGNAGALTITANQMNLQDGSYLSGATLGQGRGSTMRLDIADALTLTGTDTANSQTGIYLNSFASGNAGSLEILNARQILVQGGALISGTASRTGQAGNISINTPNGSVRVSGVSNNPRGQTASSILSETRASGQAGDITVNVRQLLVQDGGQVAAQTIGTGQAGTLTVNASELVQVTGATGSFVSRLFLDTTNTGNAGELAISTPRLLLQNGGRVSARTSGDGEGGLIRVVALEGIEVNGSSGAFDSGLYFDSSGSGNARGITITTPQLTMQNNGQVTVSGTGTGISGNIDISAGSISLVNQARIRATTRQSEGGNIVMRLSNPNVSIWMANNSEISAEAFGLANAGMLTIDAAGAIISRSLADNNDIVANAIYGRGGNINATASLILNFREFQGRRTSESDFTSLSVSPLPGVFPGEININTLDSPSTQTLPEDLLPDQMAIVCHAGSRAEQRSEFVISGAGGMPTRSGDAMSSEAIAVGLVAPVLPSEPITKASKSLSPPLEIVEAQRLIKLSDGTIALVAPSIPTGLPVSGCQTP
ncbi:filamentous hemagglutinin N-terminal domain-containing protein [Pantanalinema sp. GBBB05]|uniref:two-partner secretion domain-containing protein n=1 Tax=Pantanalinema sp. GBBB05 TaxID=2604139 RepID=UPI001E01C0E1|nr:filamentous hemagglutinin N-terminal domain-containing protein [Pantanalinema sp. GBBB05]